MSDRPTILYVEPEKLIREHIGEGLELEGHRVLLAHHAREGLDILEQATNKIDLILSNISMPNMNGYDFFTAVRANKNWSDIAFIFLTGRAARTDVRLGLSLGVTDYLTLPTTMEDVLNAVDIAIKRQRRLYGKHVGFLETRLAIEPSAIFNHKPTLFLSYAREDRIPVSEIYSFLQASGCAPWMDIKKIMVGEDWEHEIVEAIEHSQFFVACLSSNSIDKVGYVQKELKKGLSIIQRYPEGKVYILPIRLDACAIPESLGRYHILDWFDPDARSMLNSAIRKHST